MSRHFRLKAADSELYGRVRARTPYAYSDMECPKSVFPMIRVGNTNSRSRPYHHPTAKPLPTMEWLVSSYSDEGSTVLDCWMGSGTTGDACINTGRSFVGIDDKPAYFAAASDRIAAAESATPLLNHAGAASP